MNDRNYYEHVDSAGIDPMFAYRYLSWRLNCPHHTDEVKKQVEAQKPSPDVVFNYLGDKLVEQFGTAVEDNYEK